jgi:peptidyl-prolyl cis-trans isomerase B (cyclophilin B)
MKHATLKSVCAALVFSVLLISLACAKTGHGPASEREEAIDGVILVTDFGTITIAFDSNVAPSTVDNFKKLVGEGFYDGTYFHRVIPDFMIQGGDPNTRDKSRANDGTGGPGYTIKAEFSQSRHVRGTVSMARKRDPNSAGSQFFICVAAVPHLDGQYTVFGRVVKGMEVVDKIVGVSRDTRDNPLEHIHIQKAYLSQ